MSHIILFVTENTTGPRSARTDQVMMHTAMNSEHTLDSDFILLDKEELVYRHLGSKVKYNILSTSRKQTRSRPIVRKVLKLEA